MDSDSQSIINRTQVKIIINNNFLVMLMYEYNGYNKKTSLNGKISSAFELVITLW